MSTTFKKFCSYQDTSEEFGEFDEGGQPLCGIKTIESGFSFYCLYETATEAQSGKKQDGTPVTLGGDGVCRDLAAVAID